MKKYHKLWYEKNRERKLKQGSEWRKNNPDIAADISTAGARRYRKKYPQYQSIRRFNRRTPNGNIFLWQWIEIKEKYRNSCLCCGRTEPDIKLEPDHIVPVIRGGMSTIDNIQPLCRSCNARKRDKVIDYRKGVMP